ncbi:hypothetical protein [Flammeovirga kamogawensis]|uniref:Alpha/beta hydrolase n=1 Tax=Flammeovirga kamogawensis TaxID=373891 RepID=A0ABX8GR61_9BACT|nr:hypothetical protein [Flammeovirga kamogawensis]MBB6463236.1 hypothetical protein [Flammeovirga kamogawensis]QWG05914.1 hypothetical protein KM029_11095 [Flammeovirga kamogawensis]TRX67739.1 hypothetical protein EO216_06105 [Flammeovirga kamogawensis]
MIKKIPLLGYISVISFLITSCIYKAEIPPSYVVSDGTSLNSFVKVSLDASETSPKTTFYTSIDLNNSTPISEITSLTLVVHGLSYDYQNQFQTMYNTVYDIGQVSKTIVIAPYFSNNSADNTIYWTNATWRYGGNSVGTLNSQPQSSYLLLEKFLKNYVFVDGKFPNLKTIMLIGHSAGGQYIQRYAALNNLEQQYQKYTFKYLVSDPSSYLYINKLRYSDIHKAYIQPDTVQGGCNEYNNYYYGLNEIDQFTDYRNDLDSSTIVTQNIARLVTYATGTEDLDNSDDSCPANWEGGGNTDDLSNSKVNNRYKRSLYMMNFYSDQYPESKHSLFEVPGADHDAAAIYRSVTFMSWLKNNL